ncbi:MAG: vitamin B12-dependent ribonucleotide reductase [Armatimonadetes bacterium]|nr:vitamin B12-dependent ribonucleotide reductase [Armatimonadota bacterium]
MAQIQVTNIIKRDGRIEEFQPQKIVAAIRKALVATGQADGKVADDLAANVVRIVQSRFDGAAPRVEDVQDIVEEVLMEAGYPETAKAYILYREQRAEVRSVKKFIGVEDDLKLGVNAISVLKRRYLVKDEQGNVVETPSQLFRRVARAVAAPDKDYDADVDLPAVEEEFYQMMSRLEFLPNSPCLMNAGTPLGQLAACFVIPVEDSMEGIFTALKDMALIHQSGGGTGFSFSRLRPKGDIVRSTMGVASGPVSFMKIFDAATNTIKQGGRRRGANMGILRVDHPDILEFITSKSKPGVLDNFNISVSATDAFLEAVKSGGDYELINPKTNRPVKRLRARDVFDLIVAMAWQTGDPGLIFIDEINRRNPTPHIGQMESTNPCGEVPLLPHESCNLGSIDLSRMVSDGKLDYDKLRRAVRSATHFLDNVIDASKYPLAEITEITHRNRKIGLGVMGFADALIQLGIPYDSEEALEFGEKVMTFIYDEAEKMSQDLAEKRGEFPNYKGSIWDKPGARPRRNATATSVAPTGTISIIAGSSSGIEPLFAVAYVRDVMEGTRLLEVNKEFENIAKARGFYSRDLMMDIARQGSIQGMDRVPKDVQRLFVTSMDIDPEWHARMQAAFQRHVDNAVAKTVNLPREATPEDVRRIYWMSYDLGCKGITIYRYGSKPEQVLYVGPVLARELGEDELVAAESEFSGGCPTGVCPF